MTHPFVYPTISMQLETADGVFEKNTSKTLSKIVLTSTDGTNISDSVEINVVLASASSHPHQPYK